MLKGEPKWWKIILKEPALWLPILSILGIILTYIGGKVLDISETKSIHSTEYIKE